MRYVLLLILLLTLVIGCCPCKNEPEQVPEVPSELICNASYKGKSVNVKKNQEIYIELKGLEALPVRRMPPIYDKDLLLYYGEMYIKPKEDIRNGVQGKRIYRFKALKKGKTKIEFNLQELKDKPSEPIPEFEMKLIIE